MHRPTNEAGSKSLSKKELLLIALGGAVGLFALVTTTTPLFGTPTAPSAGQALRRRQLSHATPLERVGKVIDHTLKPRFGKHKGKGIGGDWVHKAVGDSEGVSRPDLGMMRADEVPPAPARANDSVLRLGGGLRNGPTVKAIQDRRAPQPPRQLQLIKAAPPTFGITPATPEEVVPVDQVNGGAKDNDDKSMLLSGHGQGHQHGHEHEYDLDLNPLQKSGHPHDLDHLHAHGHDHDLDHLHKQGHGHGHKKKHVNPLVVAHLYTKKKAMQAAHQVEKAVLKAKGHQLHHELEKKSNEVHRDIAKAVHGHAAHIKKTKKQAEAKAAHVAHVAHAAGQTVHAIHDAHAHEIQGHHHRALQPGQNLSEEDKEKLRMIARDAALKVLKEAARDAGFDAALLAEAEEEAENLAGAKAEDYEEEEVEEALANLLSLDDLLLLNKPASSFLDRAQMTNATANTTTDMSPTATSDTPLIQGMLLALRDMNMTAIEAERLRGEARTAAMQAIRDVVREAGMEERLQGNTNLETLFNNLAQASGTGEASATTDAAAAATTTTPAGNRMLHHDQGHHEDEDEEGYMGRRQLAGRWSFDDDEKHEHEHEWDEAYFSEGGAGGRRSFEDYNKHGTHGSLGKRGYVSGNKGDRQLWNYYSGRKTEGWGGSDGEDEAFWEDEFFAEAQQRRQGKRGHHTH